MTESTHLIESDVGPEHASHSSKRAEVPAAVSRRHDADQPVTLADIDAVTGAEPTPPGSRVHASTGDFLAALESEPFAKPVE